MDAFTWLDSSGPRQPSAERASSLGQHWQGPLWSCVLFHLWSACCCAPVIKLFHRYLGYFHTHTYKTEKHKIPLQWFHIITFANYSVPNVTTYSLEFILPNFLTLYKISS